MRGFSGLPDTNWAEFEDWEQPHQHGQPAGQARTRTPTPIRGSNAREKRPARPSTSGSTSSLALWLRRSGAPTQPSPSISISPQPLPLPAQQRYNNDNRLWIEDHPPEDAATGPLNEQDEEAQIAAAIVLSLREQTQRGHLQTELDQSTELGPLFTTVSPVDPVAISSYISARYRS